MAQNTTMRATNYPNAPVKQNSFKGIILVADNMTNWLHKASANPVAFKRANVGASVQPVQNPYIMLCKAKAQPLAKVIKRS
ncbi:hypothetical protein [Adhaeribacter arboris]|nr:hypothetical protein [Adhaeribacter arboris]